MTDETPPPASAPPPDPTAPPPADPTVVNPTPVLPTPQSAAPAASATPAPPTPPTFQPPAGYPAAPPAYYPDPQAYQAPRAYYPGYEAAPNYQAPPGYQATPGYQAAPGYQPPSGYPATPGYEAPPGYQSTPGYQAPPGYPAAPGYAAQPGYPPTYGYPGYPPPPPADPGTNGFAIASLVASFFGGTVISIGLGITALLQIRNSGQRGRGMAIAGIVISSFVLLVICGALAIGFVQGVRDGADEDAGSGYDPGPVPTITTDYQLGECLNNIDGAVPKATSCETPHQGEVYAIINLPNGPWPGESAVRDDAEARCEALLDRYLTDHPNLDFYYTYPDEEDWANDHTVVCMAYDPEGDLTEPLVK